MTMRPPPASVVDPASFAEEVPTGQAARWARLTAAFAEAASVIAREADLSTVLDRLASEVRAVTGLLTCAIILVDEVTEALHHVGRSGLPDDYPKRVEEARRNGPPMATLEAYRQRRAVVATGSRARVLGDPRWAPTQDIVRDNDWDTFVAVPLIVRGEPIGVMTGFSPGGSEPSAADMQFLQAMADHAAIAVDNARMSAALQLRAAEEERQRLARDLHDSVNQAIFSLTLCSRGLELRVRDSGDAPLDREALAGGLRELRELAQEALSDMRSLIEYRRPLELRDHGLVGALETLAESTSRSTPGRTGRCTSTGPWRRTCSGWSRRHSTTSPSTPRPGPWRSRSCRTDRTGSRSRSSTTVSVWVSPPEYERTSVCRRCGSAPPGTARG
jgi:signal transduction histidine kinase